MASIQARHSRRCGSGKSWTPADAVDGCSCTPVLHVVFRQDGRLIRERVGRNRRDAERALHKLAAAADDGSYTPQQNIRFDAWADTWLEQLERKATTIDSYRSTVAYAKQSFGAKLVRRLTTQDIAAFSRHLAEVKVSRPGPDGELVEATLSASTRAKHLRVLGACLNSAVKHGYAGRNVASDLPTAEKPRPQRKEAAYFDDDELPRLFAKIEPGVYRVLFEVALKTGMRLGELLALTWGDVDLAAAVIRVRRSYTDGHLGVPKNHEIRDVDLVAGMVERLGGWWGECGRPGDDCLVFPGDGGSVYLSGTTILRRELYPAMKAAEVPRVGPTGEKRTFHSFRHTFARTALENGGELTWLSRHLGHSSTAVTDRVYGHWSRKQRKRQMERLAGAFSV